MERNELMKNPNRLTLATISLILVLTLSAFIAILPAATAQFVDRGQFKTFAYVSAVPDPVGVGQTVLVTYRVDQPAAGATIRSGLFNGTSVTITKPDGTTELKQNLEMDSTSSGWFAYTPSQTGTYYFQMHFPQQGPYLNERDGGFFGAPAGIYTYLADDSEKIPLVVQADPIKPYDRSPPLPTGYWTRPINAENKGWWQVTDNWLMIGYDQTSRSFAGNPTFAPYTSGPQSAHVLYSKPIIAGGIVGGMYGDNTYYTGISYEQFFNPMILQGTVMYTEHGHTSSTAWGTRFFDLYTGEDYPAMYMNGDSVSFCQLLQYDSGNEHGVLPYLWITSGSTWYMYDWEPNMQTSPRLRVTLTGMGGLTSYTTFGPKGEILSYIMGGPATNRWLAMFNSSRAILGLSYSGIDVWSPSGTINASRAQDQNPGAAPDGRVAAEAQNHSPYMGIEWNVTLGNIGVTATPRLVNVEEGLLVATASDKSSFPYVYTDIGIDIGAIKQNAAGAYPSVVAPLYNIDRTMIHDIHDRVSENLRDGVYVRYDEGEEVWYGFDARTGQQKWATTPVNNAWALFTRIYQIAYGKLITSGFDGIVRCWDTQNGALLWAYDKGSAGFENAYGGYPEYAGLTVADRTVYTTSDEHSSDGVLWRGSSLWAIDIDTGELKWKINGMYRQPAVVDGVLIALNSYDGQVYAFGKGPSKTTVAAPQTAAPLGTAVMITGKVTDQTPALKDTPAMSDASMTEWMEYMFMQKVCPADATGVEVTLTAIDPNGNSQTIGTTTTNVAGSYGISWTPPVEGTYQITATFEGSNSYGGSYDMTYLVVGPAAAAPQPTATPSPTQQPTVAPTPTPTVSPSVVPEPEAAPSTDIYIIAAAAATIVVAAVAAVFLKKRL